MLLWLAEVAGVPRKQLREADRALRSLVPIANKVKSFTLSDVPTVAARFAFARRSLPACHPPATNGFTESKLVDTKVTTRVSDLASAEKSTGGPTRTHRVVLRLFGDNPTGLNR
jgi:hypothetical protein